jgi:hypothetical protein
LRFLSRFTPRTELDLDGRVSDKGRPSLSEPAP